MEERSSSEPAAPDGGDAGGSAGEDPGRERMRSQRPGMASADTSTDGAEAREGTGPGAGVELDNAPGEASADPATRVQELASAHDPTLSERLLPTHADDLQPRQAANELPEFVLLVRQPAASGGTVTERTDAPAPVLDPTLSERLLPVLEELSPPVAVQEQQARAPSLPPPPTLTSPERFVAEQTPPPSEPERSPSHDLPPPWTGEIAQPVFRAEEHTRQSALVEARAVDLEQVIPSAPARPFRPPPSGPPVTLRYKKRQRGALSHLRLALQVTMALVLALVVFVLGLVVLYRWVDPPASALMLAQRLGGTPILQRWTPLERVSPQLVQAVILSEDARFCRHRGVDWEELEQAIDSARDGLPRGGSTISMQLVKNLFLWPSKSYVRKAIEIPLAYLIEAAWSKRRVLEIYLNVAEWGPGVFGAEAAARYHFRKPASLLTAREAALLAVALPNPFERLAGNPGPGTLRLADNLLLRMKAAPGLTACVRAPRPVTPAPASL